MVEIFGIDLAYFALFITIIGTGGSLIISSYANKRSTIREMKEHTDLRITSAVSAVNSKLETIEYKITTHESLLMEIKKVNRDEIVLLEKELQSIRDDVSEMQKGGTAGAIHRAESIEKRIDGLEKKVDYLIQRVMDERASSDRENSGKKTPI